MFRFLSRDAAVQFALAHPEVSFSRSLSFHSAAHRHATLTVYFRPSDVSAVLGCLFHGRFSLCAVVCSGLCSFPVVHRRTCWLSAFAPALRCVQLLVSQPFLSLACRARRCSSPRVTSC